MTPPLQVIRQKYRMFRHSLNDERSRRLWAAAEAQALPLVAAHEGEGPVAPADVDLAQQAGDDTFGEVAVHAVGPGDPTL